jgi:hypothetical protein
MDKDEAEYLDFLLRQYRLCDAYWFLEVEKKFGLDAAVELNENVWGTIGGKGAREIKKRFKIEKKGLDGFMEALNLFPWTKITGYKMEREKDKLILTVPLCPPQAARIKSGQGEFPCKAMHIKEFTAFAKEIDENIVVKCAYAPLDKHPADCFCRWEFTLKK